MAQHTKKIISLFTVLCMMLTMLSGLSFTAYAAETSVKIVSFVRGEQTDLRSSELLQAKVEGYDGNPLDLTYEWTSTLGTYLYVYNSHNMYSINNTNGEIEIYNSDKKISSSSNMSGYSYDGNFTGTGYAYAAVYGANLNTSSSLVGTVTVTVKDANGRVIGTDSHTGTVTRKRQGFRWVYEYSGFVAADLEEDISGISFGMFEGDTRNIKVLLGESSMVHVTCEECSVTDAKVSSGSAHISLSTNNGDYLITADTAGSSTSGGDATVSFSVEKGNCKFHQNTEATSTTTVYVYKKPTVYPTTDTITLTADSLDSRCTYYIHGVEGTKQADGSIIFTGLTPNTAYEIEVMGKTTDTDASYAYVYTTTLPVYNATVQVYLDGGYNAETASAYGTLVNISDVSDTDDTLFLGEKTTGDFIELNHTSKGTYTAGAYNGTFNIFTDMSDDAQLCDQELTVADADRTRYLFYYSVKYDANGGTGAPETFYEHESHHVTVSSTVPVRDGYTFLGWMDQDGNMHQPGTGLTPDIEKPYVLTAQWEKLTYANVNLNLIVEHASELGIDPSVDGDLDVHLTYRADSSEPYVEVVGKDITLTDWYTGAPGMTTREYIGLYEDISGEFEYSLNVFLNSYEVTENFVNKTTDENGKTIYNVTVRLKYNPELFNLVYNVVADSSIPDELIPQATDIKIINWNARVANAWAPISRHVDTTVDVDLNGRTGSGSYPVPVYNNGNLSYYCVAATGLTLADGTEILFETTDGINYYSLPVNGLAYGAYSANVSVNGGQDIDGTGINGAYGTLVEKATQQGEIVVTIYANRYDVIFESNGGSYIAPIEDLFTIPDVCEKIPTKDGFTFAGWYTDAALTSPVVEGEVMSSDVTLYAKWLENLTIKGTVTVDGTYILDGDVHTIHDIERIKETIILLQRIDSNGYFVTVADTKASITYDATTGTGTYIFENVPNDGKQYRVKVIHANYTDTYKNELSGNKFNESNYVAEYNGDSTAIVDAHLTFSPASFYLNFEIDATAIGEGYRPSSTEVLILYDDGNFGVIPQNWAVISQMNKNGSYVGLDTTLNGGESSNSYPVWQTKEGGSNLYDYAIKVANYTANGKDYKVDSTTPFMIYYNGSARYSALNGQTQTLTAQLVPKMYNITFEMNTEDEITNMDIYEGLDGTFTDTYYWSYGKEITAKPTRTGYVFLGWYDANGNKVTSVDPSMAENITVYAKWEQLGESYTSNYAYIFGYTDTTMGAEGPLLRCELSAMLHRLVKQNGKLGSFVYDPTSPSFADIEGEWFQSAIEFMHHRGAFTKPEGENIQPYIQITRGEAFKLICLGLGFTENTNLSNDEYAQLLHSAGYIIGDENGDLNVGGFITRAELCTLYNRIIGREYALLEDAEGNAITAETYGFTDMTNPDEWYYDIMVRATSAYDNDGFVDITLRGIRNELDDYNQ